MSGLVTGDLYACLALCALYGMYLRCIACTYMQWNYARLYYWLLLCVYVHRLFATDLLQESWPQTDCNTSTTHVIGCKLQLCHVIGRLCRLLISISVSWNYQYSLCSLLAVACKKLPFDNGWLVITMITNIIYYSCLTGKIEENNVCLITYAIFVWSFAELSVLLTSPAVNSSASSLVGKGFMTLEQSILRITIQLSR